MRRDCQANPGRFCAGSFTAVHLPRLLLLTLLALAAPATRADTSPTNCTQAALVAALAQGGVVSFTQACSLTLSSTITVSTNVILDAAGRAVSLSGGGNVALFSVPSGVTFTLRGITLTGGKSNKGGALYIAAGAQVLLTNCLVAGNAALGVNGVDGLDGDSGNNTGKNGGNGTAGTEAMGGAIFNLGSLTLFNSSFLTNRVLGGNGGNGGGGGGGIYTGGNGGNAGAGAFGYGGAIYNQGSLLASNCTFASNTSFGGTAGEGGTNGPGAFPGDPGRGAAGASGSGAAIYSVQNLSAVNCTFASNAAQSGDSTAGGTDTSNGSGLPGPRGADSLGGGIFAQGLSSLVNCTFGGNTAEGGAGGNGGDASPSGGYLGGNGGNGGNAWGGGLFNTGTVTVVNCTFSGCGATPGANGLAGTGPFGGNDGTPGNSRGGNIGNASGTFVLRNTILNTASTGTNAYDTSASRITDGGYNISSDASLNFSGTSKKKTDPLISSFADNGGPSQTMALQPGSPAIDAVPPAIAPGNDQRGVPRPQGGASDVGAYELVTIPAILTQPQSITNTGGSTATFFVYALGGTLSYQWRFNASQITNATAYSYTISSVDQTNAGTYDVIITNSFGVVTSTPATLTVIFPPVLNTQPSNSAVVVGANASFSVTAASIVPVAYQWQFNGTNLAGAAGTNAAGTSTASYSVPNAQATNAGSYSVVLSNSYGNTTSAVGVLTVYLLPSIASQPLSQTKIIGSNATFSVAAAGTSPFAYQWRFKGTNLAGATLSSYTVTNAQPTNAGAYDVRVSNLYGSTNSQPALLSVVPPLTISGQVFDTTGTNGFAGVTLSAGTNSVLTDSNGNFVLFGLSSNSYTVTPLLTCYRFGPSNILTKVGPTNAAGLTFFATNDYYAVGGFITNGQSGVTITVTGTNGTSTGTSTAGLYSVSNLCPGFYYVVPSQLGYRFLPATNTVQVPPENSAVSFTAVQVFGISGTVTQGTNGPGLPGITVTISGPVSTNVTTGVGGVYVAGGLQAGTYQVAATAPGCYHTTQPPITVTLSTNNAGQTDFVLLKDAYVISGRVTNSLGGVAGITVTANSTNSVVSAADGSYAFTNLCAGSYALTTAADCYSLTPASLRVSVGPDTNVNFAATKLDYSVSGRITSSGLGLSNVTVRVGAQTTTTDAAGNYTVAGFCPGDYSVVPTQSCRIFNPVSTQVHLGPSTNNINFVSFSDDLSQIRGRVLDGANGVANIVVTATGGRTTSTDAAGNYSFANLCPGIYTITPLVTNRCLNASSQTITVASAQTTNGVNFVAIAAAYHLSGVIVGMPPGPPVTLFVVGPNGTNTIVSVTGAYALSNLCSGTYDVTPSNTCFDFYPPSRSTTVGPSDDAMDFAVSGGGAHHLAGRVTVNGLGISNVLVTAAGQTNRTDAAGLYTFPYLCDGPAIVTPVLAGYSFAPASQSLVLSSNTTLPDFVGFPSLVVTPVSNGMVRLSFTPAITCQILASTNLAQWQPVFTTNNLSASPLTLQYLDTNTHLPERFYRLSETFSNAPALTGLSSASHAVSFNAVAAQVIACQILASTNLTTWSAIYSSNLPIAAPFQFPYSDPEAQPSRYYRLSQIPGF